MNEDKKSTPPKDSASSGANDQFDELYQRLRERLLEDMQVILEREGRSGDIAEVLSGYVEEMLRSLTAGPAALLFREAGAAKHKTGGDDEDKVQAELVASMADAYLTWVTRGFSFWGSLAQQHGSFSAKLVERCSAMKADPQRFEEERRALLDDMGAYLREMADLSMREARVLQSELEKIGGDLRDAMERDATMDAPRRFAKAKP